MKQHVTAGLATIALALRGASTRELRIVLSFWMLIALQLFIYADAIRYWVTLAL